jgi:endonuclease III
VEEWSVNRREKAERIRAVLDRLYPLPPIPLRHEDPYTLLVAVVLSAQCTDRRVNEVTPRLFARARTPRAMAAMSVREIDRLVRPCGLSLTKARHLRALSRVLIERHRGQVPRSFSELEALPGVGHKTASVVMAQAFGEPAFPVDTHIHRLAARWGLSDGTSVARTERDLKRLWPPEVWSAIHLQIIYFGREHCRARGHEPARCPICAWATPRARRAPAPRRPRSPRHLPESRGSEPAISGRSAARHSRPRRPAA